jgi:hypothetical protein
MSNLSTTNVEDKRSKIAKLREKHQPVFDALGIPEAIFIPKMAYKPVGKDEKHLGFFPSELGKESDIYTEFVSIENNPEDPERKLYKLRHNPHYATEYEQTPPKNPNEKSSIRYLVPVSELIPVKSQEILNGQQGQQEQRMVTKQFELVDPETDPPYGSMTLRDYACIQLRVPESGKPWLNEIIKKANNK